MSGRFQQVVAALTSTMKINPDDYSPLTSSNRVVSLGYALAGCLYMLRHQKNVRIQSVATVLVVLVGLWLQIDVLRWAILVLTIALVWIVEFVNAAVEAAVNLAASDIQPMAKVGKDVAAAAVLLSVIASIVVGVLLLGEPLLQKLGV